MRLPLDDLLWPPQFHRPLHFTQLLLLTEQHVPVVERSQPAPAPWAWQ